MNRNSLLLLTLCFAVTGTSFAMMRGSRPNHRATIDRHVNASNQAFKTEYRNLKEKLHANQIKTAIQKTQLTKSRLQNTIACGALASGICAEAFCNQSTPPFSIIGFLIAIAYSEPTKRERGQIKQLKKERTAIEQEIADLAKEMKREFYLKDDIQ